MRAFMKGIMQWKNYACMMFTGSVCLYGIIAFSMGDRALNLGILLQLLVISALGTLIQGIAFNPEWIIKKARYTTRMILFVVPFLIMLMAFALAFNWFPMDNMVSWFIFFGTFLATFIIMTASFEIVFRISGKRYNGLLGQYKKAQQKK